MKVLYAERYSLDSVQMSTDGDRLIHGMSVPELARRDGQESVEVLGQVPIARKKGGASFSERILPIGPITPLTASCRFQHTSLLIHDLSGQRVAGSTTCPPPYFLYLPEGAAMASGQILLTVPAINSKLSVFSEVIGAGSAPGLLDKVILLPPEDLRTASDEYDLLKATNSMLSLSAREDSTTVTCRSVSLMEEVLYQKWSVSVEVVRSERHVTGWTHNPTL